MSSFWSFTKDAESKTLLSIALTLPCIVWDSVSLPSLVSYAVIAITTYFANRCCTPPALRATSAATVKSTSNVRDDAPSASITKLGEKEKVGISSTSTSTRDAIKWVMNATFRNSVKFTLTAIGFYHAFIALSLPSPPPLLCPNPQNIDTRLFTISPISISFTSIAITAALLRMATYHQLGQNFTFNLTTPTHLVTGGMYRYIRHPSYTMFILAMLGCSLLVFREKGVVACWVESEGNVVKRLVMGYWGLFTFGALSLVRRVQDEEDMLEGLYGKEWVEWKKGTWKLVPGVW